MNKERYEKSMRWIENRIGITAVRILMKVLTGITVVAYGATLLWLLYQIATTLLTKQHTLILFLFWGGQRSETKV